MIYCITCFKRTVHKIKPLPKNKIREACELIANGYLQAILDFGIHYGCFSQLESYTLRDGILLWDGLDTDSSCTTDTEKLWELYTHMGVTKELFDMYKSNDNENSAAFVLLDIESVLPEKYEIVSTDFSSTWIKDTDTNKVFKMSISEESADTYYEKLLINAFEWAINDSNQTTRDLIHATGISSEQLTAIGYDKENFPQLHEWADE